MTSTRPAGETVIHDLNDHRRTRRQRKADALRVAIKDQAGDTADTPDGLRLLAEAAWQGRKHVELWTNLAVLAGVNVPGASYVEGRDPEWTRFATIALVRDGLRRDADDLELELADRAS